MSGRKDEVKCLWITKGRGDVNNSMSLGGSCQHLQV